MTRHGKTTNFIHETGVNNQGNKSLEDLGVEMFFQTLAGQWMYKQMVAYVNWQGALNKTSQESWVQLDLDQATSLGVCTWVAAFTVKPTFPLSETPPPAGVLSGENNGLTLYLDLESFDYVDNDRGGLGLKVAVTHPMDMPIIEQSAVTVMPGFQTQLGVSVKLTKTSSNAINRFSPKDRKCWSQSEVAFKYLPYSYFYQYSMSNCLFEAAMQEAKENCGCIPGYIRAGENPCFGRNLSCYNHIIRNIGETIDLDNNSKIISLCQAKGSR